MCKRNSPNTNEASTGRVRENPLIKKQQKNNNKKKQAPDAQEKLT